MEPAKSEPPALAKELCESSNIEPSLEWFKDNPEFRAWIRAHSAKLWLHGENGDGKTVIMSYVLRRLSRYTPESEGTASIFCSCNDSEEGVVASIVLQLLRNKDHAKDSRLTFPITKFQPGDGRPGFNRLLWGLFARLIETSRVVLIIDGIDKLDFSVRSSFLDKFDLLERDGTRAGIRVLISSKTRDDIQSALRHYSSIDREKERRGE
jgi:Cdc6-like AAA superfamily ATPase